MNTLKVRKLLELYRRDFEKVHNLEIYKWQAVKHFQDAWNINASNFAEMLHESLWRSQNLLAAGNYYPLRMLFQVAEREPVRVRELFVNLYDETADKTTRIKEFQREFILMNENYFPGTNDFQDEHALSVYLHFEYPERYYIYKFTLFKDFANLIEYPYTPTKKRGASTPNFLEYQELCDLLRAEVVSDKKLIALYRNRLTDTEYPDPECFLLTQDFLWASVKHFADELNGVVSVPATRRLVLIDKTMESQTIQVQLKAHSTNYLENERAQKRIGDLGELLVLQYEREKLLNLGFDKNPIHASKEWGDGLGYDILSYDKNGNELFIEVKTTLGLDTAPFYLTFAELDRSKQDSNKFRLYRLFDYDVDSGSAKFILREGSVEDLCTNPQVFKVYPK